MKLFCFKSHDGFTEGRWYKSVIGKKDDNRLGMCGQFITIIGDNDRKVNFGANSHTNITNRTHYTEYFMKKEPNLSYIRKFQLETISLQDEIMGTE